MPASIHLRRNIPHGQVLEIRPKPRSKSAAMKAGIEEDSVSVLYHERTNFHSTPRRKRMTTIHRSREGDLAFVKGAPREVLQLCTQILINGETLPLDENVRAEIMSVNDEYARRALRVLALARRTLPPRSGTILRKILSAN